MEQIRKLLIVACVVLVALCGFLAYACLIIFMTVTDPQSEIISGAVGLVWLAAGVTVLFGGSMLDKALLDEIRKRKRDRNRRIDAEVYAARQRVRSRNSH